MGEVVHTCGIHFCGHSVVVTFFLFRREGVGSIINSPPSGVERGIEEMVTVPYFKDFVFYVDSGKGKRLHVFSFTTFLVARSVGQHGTVSTGTDYVFVRMREGVASIHSVTGRIE